MITPAKARKFAVDLEDTIGLSNAHDKDIAKAREVIRDLAQQVEDLQKDAARYRWLRLHTHAIDDYDMGSLFAHQLDEILDKECVTNAK